jgi:hypothetical protein
MTIEEMLGRLELDIENDARKMFRWRQIHRVVACGVTLTLIVLPVAVAMKDLGYVQPYCLFALTVIAAYDGLFRPAAHSARRRSDAADMTDLLWEFRSARLATPATDAAARLAVHDSFRQRYQALFRARGRYLVDFSLAQHENETAAGMDTKPPAHSKRAASDSAEAGAAGAAKPVTGHPIAPIAPREGAMRRG